MISKLFHPRRRKESYQVAPHETGLSEISILLTTWDARDPEAQARLLALVYPELRRMAAGRMRRERFDHTLQPTALVNEFVVRLCASQHLVWRDRAHFLAVASRAMRRILVDYARAHNAEKRGGDSKLRMEGLEDIQAPRVVDVLEIHEVLEQLAEEDERMAKIVEMRYFGGLQNSEVAEALGVSERTVKRDWELARAWLYARLRRKEIDADGTGKTDI